MKIKIIKGDSAVDFEVKMNQFLQTIDIRQVVKIEKQYDNSTTYRGFIYYINEFADLRDLKIDSVLFTKN